MLDGIIDWVTQVVETLSYAGVAFLVALENVFPPIPSEMILPLSGFVAGRGDANLIGMIGAATLGSLLGAWVLYGISARIDQDRLRDFLARHGRWFGVKEGDLIRAEEWFDRRSGAAVFLGRCVPLIRSIVSVPAGVRRMDPWRFTLLTTLGSLIWNTTLIGAGAILGDRWEEVGDAVGLLQTVVIVLAALGALYWTWRRFLQPRLARTADDAT